MRTFITIKTEEKYVKIFIDETLYCKAEGAYTVFYLENDKKLCSSKLLKDVEELLADNNFFRINRQYLVNLDHCYELITGKNPTLVLSNSIKLSVSLPKMKRLRMQFCLYSQKTIAHL